MEPGRFSGLMQPNNNILVSYFSVIIEVFCIFQVRMVRENNQKTKAGQEEEQPKFGAGSEFGREQKEEARRKKFGFVSKKYNPDAQPWLMRVGSKKDGKHYRGEKLNILSYILQ